MIRCNFKICILTLELMNAQFIVYSTREHERIERDTPGHGFAICHSH